MTETPDYIADHVARTDAIRRQRIEAWEAQKAMNPWPLDTSAREGMGLYDWIKERGD